MKMPTNQAVEKEVQKRGKRGMGRLLLRLGKAQGQEVKTVWDLSPNSSRKMILQTETRKTGVGNLVESGAKNDILGCARFGGGKEKPRKSSRSRQPAGLLKREKKPRLRAQAMPTYDLAPREKKE